jgi:hypothetical protein
LACLGAGILAVAVFPVVAVLLARFARVELAQVVFGTGPKLFTKRFGKTSFELRALPIQSWVKAVGQGVYDPEPDPTELAPGRVPWRQASRARRALAFVVAPRAVVFAAAAIALGLPRAAGALGRGVVEVFTGAIGPFSTAHAVLERGADVLAREGAGVVVALALAKYVAFSVLTLPGDLAGALDATGAESKAIAKARVFVFLATLAIIVSWIVAWIGWGIS